MAGREPTPGELQAAALVAEQVGGKEVPRDGVGAPAGMHDFDIQLPGGRCIALEVTAVAHPDVVAFHNLMGDTEWVAPTLQTDWWVALPDPEPGRPAIRVKQTKPEIVSALATLEAHDITQLDPGMLDEWVRLPESTPPAVIEAIGRLGSIGIRFVRSTGQRADDVARLLFSSHGSASSNADQLNDLVAERVEAKQKKLAAAQAPECHLFIWLTDSYPDAELAFSTLPPPPAAPPIPPSIDVVWLARWAWPIRLWRLLPAKGWEVVK